MKKYSKKIISFALVVMMSMTMFVPAFANDEISVYLDNEKIQFDVAPLLVNGRTMVPMRAIFEKLGAVVYWDNNTRTAIAQKGNVNVSIAIDDTILYKNGEPIILDVPAQLNGGRTLVPLRAVSEAFECDVQWKGDTRTVNISSSMSLDSTQEAINKLISWVNNNSNHSLPGTKAYKYKAGNHEIDIVPTAGGEKLNLVYYETGNNKITSISIWLFNAKFCASYIDQDSKTHNSTEGYIIKSNVSNSLELSCDWYSGDYSGDKNTLLGKYQDLIYIILKVFDNFLKTSNVGLTLEDFDLNFDLSSVVLNDNQTPSVIPTPSYPQNNTPNNSYQGGGDYTTNKKITLTSFPLYLYADDGTGKFLGEISSNKYYTDSIANEYGDYGNKYNPESIFNQYGNYCNKYSQYSVFNEYATNPPKILDKNGKVVGYLTANKYIRDAISYEEMMVLLKKFRK